jgi:uncharacterized membrane protein YhhN
VPEGYMPAAWVAGVAVGLCLLADLWGRKFFAGAMKMVASSAFIAAALAAGALHSRFGPGELLLLGLALSWVGDLLLLWHRKAVFLAGLVAFLLAHLAYCAAFTEIGTDKNTVLAALPLLLLVLLLVVFWLRPHLTSLRAPVYAYMAVITLMVTLAAGAWGALGRTSMLLGAVLFYASDLFVARERFVMKSPVNRLVGLPLYYVAQFLFALSAHPIYME